MPKRPTCQEHVCSLCGQGGHNVLKCKLPGAQKYRDLLAKEKDKEKETNKQKGRKAKTRARNQSSRTKTATDKYSGKRRRRECRPKARARKRMEGLSLPADEKACLEELQALGFSQAAKAVPSL